MKEFGKVNHSAEPPRFNSDDRHQRMLQAIAPWAKKIPQKNLTPVVVQPATRKTKLLLMLLPEWAHKFPPYNLARLGSVTRAAGYETHIWDINVAARRDFIKNDWPKINYDPWDGMRDWHWMEPQYYEDLHQYMQPLLETYLEKISELKPDLIGFTLYYCNQAPTLWLAKQIKQRWPHIKIAVGGSATHPQYYRPDTEYDYVINGEGENLLLKLLEDIENGVEHDTPMTLRQPENEKMDLDKLPLPDYSFFDFSQYDIPNGVNSELSRGCTAKCTFCEETHFYRYRQRQASSVLKEVTYLYDTYGIDTFWFIDSLVNGNLKELRAFCKGIIAAGMNIHWTGYARCDGRMDLEYYNDLAESGCVALNYGCESGSQAVLDAIDKRVTVEEMEENFRNGKLTGVEAYTNWIVAFPTETLNDFADTMTMLWRNRNNNISVISPGQGFGVGLDTIVGQNLPKFGLSDIYYMRQWIRSDFTMGKLHRMMRVKTFNIFLDHLVTEQPIAKSTRPELAKTYNIEFVDPTRLNDIEYEKFDYDIINANINPFANTALNEIWPLLRMLWRARGGYKAHIRFNEQEDYKEFGSNTACPFNAEFKFEISDLGEWTANFSWNFTQPDDPWMIVDYTRDTTNASIRARRLARPDLEDPTNAFSEEEWYQKVQLKAQYEQIDLSFAHTWKGSGNWSKVKSFDTDENISLFTAMLRNVR